MRDRRDYVGRHRKKEGILRSLRFGWILHAVVIGLASGVARAILADLVDVKEVLKAIKEGLQEGR